jgi:hypothetical protein
MMRKVMIAFIFFVTVLPRPASSRDFSEVLLEPPITLELNESKVSREIRGIPIEMTQDEEHLAIKIGHIETKKKLFLGSDTRFVVLGSKAIRYSIIGNWDSFELGVHNILNIEDLEIKPKLYHPDKDHFGGLIADFEERTSKYHYGDSREINKGEFETREEFRERERRYWEKAQQRASEYAMSYKPYLGTYTGIPIDLGRYNAEGERYEFSYTLREVEDRRLGFSLALNDTVKNADCYYTTKRADGRLYWRAKLGFAVPVPVDRAREVEQLAGQMSLDIAYIVCTIKGGDDDAPNWYLSINVVGATLVNSNSGEVLYKW